MNSRIVLAFACALCAPRVALAQAVVRIVSTSGTPIENSSADIWRDGRLISSERTDSAGFLRTATTGVASATVEYPITIRARRIGFAPRTMQLDARADTVTIALDPAATVLPEMVAQVLVECPQEDDPVARRYWESARSRYGTSTHGLSLWWAGDEAIATVAASEIGAGIDANPARGNHYRRAEFLRHALGVSIPPAYAARIDPVRQPALTDNGRYSAWRYPELEAMDASHFADEEFGRSHTMRIGRRSSETTTLIFCSASRDVGDGALLDGTLTLGADNELLGATWGFTTASPNEHAGGTVTLGKAFLDGAIRPVALEGTFWRQLTGRDRYLERAVVMREWSAAKSDATH